MKMYVEECMRLRGMLEEVLKERNKEGEGGDISEIEEKYYQQNILLKNIKHENSELALGFQRKEDELNRIKRSLQEIEKKNTKNNSVHKENNRQKKRLKEFKREIKRLKQEVAIYKSGDVNAEGVEDKLRQIIHQNSQLQEELE